MPALLPRSRRLTSLTYRLLHPELPPSESPIVRALCRAAFLKSHKHLSGFNHFELESSEAGKLVEWYNVQFYCGWGDASNTHLYEALVTAGWNPQKLVLGVVTNPGNGAGHVPLEKLQSVVKALSGRYRDQFGGIMGWEYFNAVREKDVVRLSNVRRGAPETPWMWVFDVAHALGKVDISTSSYEEAERKAYGHGPPPRPYLSATIAGSSHPVVAPNQPVVGGSTNATIQAENPFAQLIAQIPSAPPPPPPPTPASSENNVSVQRLVEMGADRAEAIAALEAMEGNVDAAAALLFGD